MAGDVFPSGRNRGLVFGVFAMLKKVLSDARGATAIEYALIATCISIAIATIVFTIGSQLSTTMYTAIANMF